MLELLSSLNWLAVLTATMLYYLLGALWFAPPVFGHPWQRAIGFDPPAGWRPGASVYVGSLFGCLAATLATALLARALDTHSVAEGLTLGLIVGLGYGAAIAGGNAVAPAHPRPFRVFVIVGTYHVVGLVLVALLLTLWR